MFARMMIYILTLVRLASGIPQEDSYQVTWAMHICYS